MLTFGPTVDIEDTLDDALAAAARVSRAWAPAVALPPSADLGDGEDVAVWLARAFAGAASGRLWLSAAGVERTIFLECGRPVLVTSDDPAERLGAWLIRQGRLTTGARDRALAESLASGRRLGAVLVDQGALPAGELLGVLRGLQEEIVVAAVLSDRGVIGFDPGVRAERSRIRLLRHPALLVRDGLARHPRPHERRTRLGLAAGQRLVLREGPLAAHVWAALGAGPEQRRAVARLDGHWPGGAPGDEVVDPGAEALAQALWLFGVLAPPSAAGAAWRRQDRQLQGERVLALLERARMADYFSFVGVDPRGGGEDVRAALARVAATLAAASADADIGGSLTAEIAVVAAVLEEAGRVLGDEHLRDCYRAAVAAGRTAE
jgi:hypothetical protein